MHAHTLMCTTLLVQASEEYIAGNVDEAVFYFEEAMATSQQSKTVSV